MINIMLEKLVGIVGSKGEVVLMFNGFLDGGMFKSLCFILFLEFRIVGVKFFLVIYR